MTPSYVILGGGAVVGEFYLPALEILGWLNRAVVVDPFESSLAAIRARFPQVATVAASHAAYLEQLTANGDERVVITLPNPLHVEAAHAALAKQRHVLCEKPLALRAADCAGLVVEAKHQGRQMKVAMSRRYLASLMLARQMVRAGELGAVHAIQVVDESAFGWKPRSFAFFSAESGGVLADMGVHYLDFLDTVVGPMTPVDFTSDARGGAESNAAFRLTAGEVPVSLKLSRLHSAGAFVSIQGARGEIVVDKAIETGLTFKPKDGAARTVTLAHPFDDPTWPADFHGSFTQMLVDFERAIEGIATPIADAADAERVIRLIEWAYQRRPAAAARSGAPVAVTGGTGFIGGHLVDRLTAEGRPVRAAVRSPASMANLARFPIEAFPADITDPVAARRFVAGAQTVYHLAYGKEADARRITVEGTKAIVEAAIAERAECVVVLSTMYVYGFPSGGRPVDETFPYRPYGGEYGTSKAEMERWCLERAKTSGATRIVVLNPTCVFGPAGGAYTALPIDLARQGQFCWIEGGRGSCNYIYVENLIDAIEAAAKVEAAHGQRFILNDGVSTWREFVEPLLIPLNVEIPDYTLAQLGALPRYGAPFRWRDLARAAISSERVREVAKRSPAVRRRFQAMTESAARRGDDGHAFSYRPAQEVQPPSYPPEWLGDLFGPARATFSAEKARKVLGWTPRIGLAEARGLTLDWLRATGRLP